MAARTYYYGEELARTTTTNTTYSAVKATVTFTPAASTTYAVFWSALVDASAASNEYQVRLQNTTDSVTLAEGVCTVLNATTNVVPYGGVALYTSGGSPASTTLEIQGAVSNAALTLGISETAILVVKLEAGDVSASSTGTSTKASTSYSAKATLSFTPATTGDYLVVMSTETQLSVSGTDGVNVRVNVNSAATLANVHESNFNYDSDNTQWHQYTGACILTAASGAQTVTLDYACTNALNGSVRNAYAVALRLDAFNSAFYDADTTQHTSTSTTDADGASVTGTPAAEDYAIIAVGQTTTNQASTNTSSRSKVDVGGDVGTTFGSPKGYLGYLFTWFALRKRTETAVSTTWKTQYARAAGTGNATFDDYLIAALQLSASAIPVYAGKGTSNRQSTMATAVTPTCPATVNAGDLLLLVITDRSNANETYTTSGAGTWIDHYSTGGAATQVTIKYKIADGTEDGATVTCTASAGSSAHRGTIYRFTGAHQTTPLSTPTSHNNTNTVTVTDEGVTTTGVDRLAVNILSSNLDQTAIGSMTGESGGDWTQADYENSGSVPPVVSLQTAGMATAGTVDGGSVTIPSSTNTRSVGFYILSPGGASEFTPTTGALALVGSTAALQKSLAPTTGVIALAGNNAVIQSTRAPTTGTLSLLGNAASRTSISAPATGALQLAGNAPAILSIRTPATTGTLALSGNAPSLVLNATTGSLALAGNAPSISFSSAISPATGALTLVGNVAGLTATRAPVTGTLGLAGNTATVAAVLAPSAGTLSLSGNAPAILSIRTPATGALALAGNLASLSATMSPVTAALALAGNAAAIVGTLNPATGILALAGNTPSISSTTAIVPATGALNLAGNAAALAATRVPVTGTLGLAGNVPAILTTMAVVTGTLELVGKAPSLALSPATGTLALFGNTPSVGAGVFVPAPGTLSLVGAAPSILSTRTPAATGAVVLGGNAPAITRGLAAATGALGLAGNAPALAETIAPSTGAVVLAGNTPALTASNALTPVTGALSLAGSIAALSATIRPTTGALALAGNASSALSIRAPATGTLAVGGSAATITRSLATATGVLSLAGNVPGIGGTGILSPSTGALSLAGSIAALSATIRPASGPLDLYGGAPALAVAVAPATGWLTLSGNDPSVSVLITPETGTLDLAGSSPALGSFVFEPTSGVLALVGTAPVIIWPSTEGELFLVPESRAFRVSPPPATTGRVSQDVFRVIR